jgi:hypothetical protein
MNKGDINTRIPAKEKMIDPNKDIRLWIAKFARNMIKAMYTMLEIISNNLAGSRL